MDSCIMHCLHGCRLALPMIIILHQKREMVGNSKFPHHSVHISQDSDHTIHAS